MFHARAKRLAALFLLCALLAPVSGLAQKKVFVSPEPSQLKKGSGLLHLYVLDLLGADCMMLRYKDSDMMVDLGKENQFPQLKKMLDLLGVDEVSVFNTHPHSDHLGGIFELTEHYTVPAVYTAFPEDEQGPSSVIQRKAVRHLSQKNMRMMRLWPGDALALDKDVSIRVIQNLKGKNVNERSAMLLVRYGSASMLLTADISNNSQKKFEEELGTALDVDIMKAPHHGLEDLRKDFLQYTSPEFVFFTHGSVDSKRMQKTLSAHNIPFLFATRGVIHIATDGETWYVEQLPRTLEESKKK